MHQAAANIGVAPAAMLPRISISGNFGDEAAKLGDLLSSSIWSVGANVTQPLFHGGELRAKRRAAADVYDVAAAQYRQTVLSSFADVADALEGARSGRERVQRPIRRVDQRRSESADGRKAVRPRRRSAT